MLTSRDSQYEQVEVLVDTNMNCDDLLSAPLISSTNRSPIGIGEKATYAIAPRARSLFSRSAAIA